MTTNTAKTSTSFRPYYSNVRPYRWRGSSPDEHTDGIAIFKGRNICLHLTREQAIELATELVECIDREPRLHV